MYSLSKVKCKTCCNVDASKRKANVEAFVRLGMEGIDERDY
jgi:hypothetical protein